MQSQLERLEKDEGIEWQEYEIGALFDIGTGSLVDIKSAKSGTVPRISVQTTDNGILGYYDEPIENARYFENFVSVNFFGVSYYHPYRASVEMKAHTLKLKNQNFTQSVGIFLSATLNRCFDGVFSYGNQLSSSKLKNNALKIQLPTITQNGESKIAFDFIEKFLATLNAYLKTTGLKDYALTADEQAALDSLNTVVWGEFSFSQLFDNIVQGRRLKKQDQVLGDLPFIMAGTTNTGVVGYVGNNTRTFPSNSLTVDIFGNIFYRSYEYGMGDDTGAYWNQSNVIEKYAMLYISTAMQKFMVGKFDFGHKLRSSKSFDFKIKLPIKKNNTPDYQYMSLVISAMQKVVIKNVVDYLGMRINKTDELVSQASHSILPSAVNLML